jgi:hypothetical protein
MLPVFAFVLSVLNSTPLSLCTPNPTIAKWPLPEKKLCELGTISLAFFPFLLKLTVLAENPQRAKHPLHSTFCSTTQTPHTKKKKKKKKKETVSRTTSTSINH